MAEEWYDGAYYSRKFTFRFGDCDCMENASLYAVTKLLSEIAGDDYEGRDLGHDMLDQYNMVFLISRLGMEIMRMPRYMETVVARTWERTVRGPYFYREYEILSENGELLVSGSGMWFVCDTVTREIIRPSSLASGRREANPRKSACPECGRLRLPDGIPLIGNRQICWSDLDANGHVNNAVYSRIAEDFFPEKLRQLDVKSFLINFNAETKLGENLELHGMGTEKSYTMMGISDGTVRFSCKFKF